MSAVLGMGAKELESRIRSIENQIRLLERSLDALRSDVTMVALAVGRAQAGG